MSLLELFCGSKSAGKAAAACGYVKIVSVDSDRKVNPTICVDIMNFDYKSFKVGSVYFIWASPPCTEFSVAKTTGIRRIAEASIIVRRAFKIIAYLKPRYFCVENPMGHLRLQSFMRGYERFRRTVSYCKYGFAYRKHTDLWTNTTFVPKRCVQGSLCDEKRVTGRHSTHCQSGHGEPTRSISLRYSIPQPLLRDVFESTIDRVSSVRIIIHIKREIN